MQPLSPHSSVATPAFLRSAPTAQFLVERDPCGRRYVPPGGIPVWIDLRPIRASFRCGCAKAWKTVSDLANFYAITGQPTVPISVKPQRYVCACYGRIIE